MRVVIFICGTLSWPVLHNCEVSWLYSTWFLSYGADTKLHLKQLRRTNSESMKARVVILERDTLSWPVLHICEISWLYFKRLSRYGAVMKLHLKPSRGDNSESMKARVVSFVRDTLSWLVLHNCEVLWLYSKRFLSYGAAKKLHLKPSRGNNSERMKAGVVILVRDTSSWPVLHNCEILWLYFKGYARYRADTNMHKKHQRGDNSKSIILRALIFYATHRHDLFYITVKYHQNIPNSFQVIEQTRKGRTDGSSLYPPNLSVGDKNAIFNITLLIT